MRRTRLIVWSVLTAVLLGRESHAQPIELGNRLELFVDQFLIERFDGAELRLHPPRSAGPVLHFDRPWEGAFCAYATVIRDGGLFRLYYRGLPSAGRDGSAAEVTCYAESRDGVRWTKPDLELFEVTGTLRNNVVLHGQAPASHNFSPFLDPRPGVRADERFKAVAGTRTTGLLAFVSGDGIRWRKLREEPVLREGALDSQNVVFWSSAEERYLCYFRTWRNENGRSIRSVSRAASSDFVHWSNGVEMEFGGAPLEHLYTTQTHPYFRAPHIYIATPMRLMPGRQVLTPEQAERLGVHSNYEGDCADAVFMTSRGGHEYARTFLEGWIRPGTDLGNWASRAGLTALGVVPTGPAEMSIYKQAHYAQPTAHLVRYTLRTDGFVSIHAPYAGGEVVTKPFRFQGARLVVNFATSAAGGLRTELQDASGDPLPGFALADAVEAVGDEIDRTISWKSGSDLSVLRGREVRLRFVLKDADLFSLRFR